MTEWWLLGVGSAAITTAFLLLRYRLSFLHLIGAFLGVQLLAVFRNSLEKGNYAPTHLMLLALATFVAGLAAHRLLTAEPEERIPEPLPDAAPRVDLRILAVFVALVGGFAAYHYLRAGIPLLSIQVETARFERAASGLFGIPSRLALPGTLFVVFLVGTYQHVTGERDPRVRLLLRAAYAIALLTLLLSGFKSSLIIFVEVLVILHCYVPAAREQERLSTRKIVLIGVAALGVVVLVAALYARYRDIETAVLARIADRIFYVSGLPFYYVVHELYPALGPGGGHYFWLDLQYLMGQLNLLADFVPYTGTQAISAALHGRSVLTDFNVPTTVNIFGALYLEGGLTALLAGSFGFGALCSWLYAAPFKTRNVVGCSVLLYAQLAVFSVASKGSVAYDLADRTGTLLLLLLLLGLSVLIVRGSGVRAELLPVRRFPGASLTVDR
jgi:hypothetical protein